MNDASGSGPDAPTLQVATPLAGLPEVPITSGSALGRYLVIEQIGKGGMGVVLRAYDPKLGREVALKAVRTDALSSEAQVRLVREARAMAQVSHPNVVAVYDVDEDEAGRVVLAMELVVGETLREWLARTSPAPRAILECLIAAGRGLAAAHAVGLLHRDFKLDNVLVGDDGRVRVTDFGLARPTESIETPAAESAANLRRTSDGGTSTVTRVGTVVGTPVYMAPEQHRGDVLTPAADQFAFCVGAWRALTKQWPFEAERAALAAAKMAGAPQWPRDAPPVPRAVIAALRRGLAADSSQRWPSMGALLEAIERAIEHRRSGQAIAAVAVVAVVGVVGWQATRGTEPEVCSGGEARLGSAWDEGRRAAVERALTDSPLAAAWSAVGPRFDAYRDAWLEAYAETCAATTVRREQSAEVMDLRMACLARGARALDTTTALLTEADSAVIERAHELATHLPPVAQCADVEALRAAEPLPPPEIREAVATIREELAELDVLRDAGRLDTVAERLAALAPRIDELAHAPLQVDLQVSQGLLEQTRGDYPAAERTLRAALRDALALGMLRQALISSSALTVLVGNLQARAAEGLVFADVAQGLLLRTGADPTQEADLRRAVGMSHESAGRFAEAEQEYRRALELTRSVYGEDHEYVALSINNVATSLHQQGKVDEAERELRRAVEIYGRALGPDHLQAAPGRNNLATILISRGAFAEAEREFRANLAVLTRAYGAGHPRVLQTRANLAVVLARQSQFEAAEAELRDVVSKWEAAVGAVHPDVATAHMSLGGILARLGRWDEAVAEQRHALEILIKLWGADDPKLADQHLVLSRILLDAGQAEPALLAAREAWRLAETAEAPTTRGAVAFGLARALAGNGQTAEARRIAAIARAAFEAAGEVGQGPLAALDAWEAKLDAPRR